MCLYRRIHARMLMEGIWDILTYALVHITATAGIWLVNRFTETFFIFTVGNHSKSECMAGVLIHRSQGCCKSCCSVSGCRFRHEITLF